MRRELERLLIDDKDFDVECAGHPESRLVVRKGIQQCGRITDGVAFAHGNHGGWVISFEDLERIYKFAKHQRGLP